MRYLCILVVGMVLSCSGCVNSVEMLTPPGVIVQPPVQADSGKDNHNLAAK
jgi:hypothetical protein